MVADEYFELRSRLGAALYSLGRVADLAGLKPTRAPVVKSLVEGLRDPFVFVVAGEVNTGKSTLLNALFGEEFCAMGVLPETRRIHYFRYDRTPHRTVVSQELEEIGLPHAFLRDFHVVDTPGINSIEAGHDLITGNFIPRADAVLYCFPATNPWSGAGWEFLEKIQRDGLKKIVLVLQQSDQRTTEEVAAIAEHMRMIARQRLGVDLAVFPVAARLALLARTSGLDKARLLAASCFPELEQHITSMVAGAPPRISRLVSACAAGQGILAEVQSRLTSAAAALAELTSLRTSCEETLASTRTAVQEKGAEILTGLQLEWEKTTSAAVSEVLTERLPFPALLWRADPTVETVESRLLPPLMQAVRQAAGSYDSFLQETLGALWKQPGSTIHRSLEGRVRRPPEPEWPRRGPAFTALLEGAACEALTQSSLKEFWINRLQHRRGLLRGLTLLCVLLLTGMTVAAAQGHLTTPAALWVLGLLAAGILTGRLTLSRERRETAALAKPLLAEAGAELHRTAGRLIQDHGQKRLADFQPVLTPLDVAIEQKQQAAAPLEEETGQLATTLQILSRSLRVS
jgi:GTPase SAR1 family protein